MSDILVNMEYPSELQPGEDRFFSKGLEIDPFKGRIHIEIRCSDIIITSSEKNEENIIIIKGNNKTQHIPLHFHGLNSAVINTKKEIGVFVYKKTILWKNLFFLLFISFLWFSPTFILLFRPSLITFKIGLGQFFIINIPQYILFALIFSIKRLSSIFNLIIAYKVSKSSFKESFGIFNFIKVVNNSTYTKDNLSFKFKNN
jgi:hypothetical protein